MKFQAADLYSKRNGLKREEWREQVFFIRLKQIILAEDVGNHLEKRA